MSQRIVKLDEQDVQVIVGALREARVGAVARVAATPSYLREAKLGAEAARERLERIAKTLETAVIVTATVPETGGEG